MPMARKSSGRPCWPTTGTPAWPWPGKPSKAGSHVLDVCVDYTGEDGVDDMKEVASRFATQATVPIMLDSTEPPVIEAGLQLIAGKPILNSVNLKDGDAAGTRLDRFLSLAHEYGAAVVCTCIDTEGQARASDWKLRAAQAIQALAVERYGLGQRTCSSTLSFCRSVPGWRRAAATASRPSRASGKSRPPFRGWAPLSASPTSVSALRPPPAMPSTRSSSTSARKRDWTQRSFMLLGSCPCTKSIPRRRGLPGPHLRPAGSRHRLRPARRTAPSVRGGFLDPAGDRGSQRVGCRAPSRAPHHRRRPRRAGNRSGRGPRRRMGRPRRRQRPAPWRYEGGRGSIRFGSDAASFCAAIGRDHEGRRGLPRATHGKGQRWWQGPYRAGNRPR